VRRREVFAREVARNRSPQGKGARRLRVAAESCEPTASLSQWPQRVHISSRKKPTKMLDSRAAGITATWIRDYESSPRSVRCDQHLGLSQLRPIGIAAVAALQKWRVLRQRLFALLQLAGSLGEPGLWLELPTPLHRQQLRLPRLHPILRAGLRLRLAQSHEQRPLRPSPSLGQQSRAHIVVGNYQQKTRML
jgi:hypothetical protein